MFDDIIRTLFGLEEDTTDILTQDTEEGEVESEKEEQQHHHTGPTGDYITYEFIDDQSAGGNHTTDTEEGGDFFDIKIERVGNMVNDEVMEFSSRAELIQSFYVSFNRKMMLLGYVKDDVIAFLPKNQDDKQTIRIDKDDSFIFIKY